MGLPWIIRRFRKYRDKLARHHVLRGLKQKEFTIISDDCWGGRVYSEFGLKCHSPFVGMGFTAREYLDFLCGFREPGALDILGEKPSVEGYPMLETRNAWLYGQHFDSAEEFRHTFERRRKTILWDRIFIKIDFGKTKYRPEDVARWNALKFPNSVALFPDKDRFHALNIHNGVALPDWILDGAKQFGVSCRRFDIFDWLNHGRVGLSAGYACRQWMFFEQFPGARVASFLTRSGGKVFRGIRRLLFKK